MPEGLTWAAATERAFHRGLRALLPVASRAAVVFITLFIITLPFPYHLLPSVGDYLRPWTEPPVRWVGDHLLHIGRPYTAAIVSDSTGMYIHALVVLAASIAIAVAWTLSRWRRVDSPRMRRMFGVAVSYYLALTLLEYGLDKLFKRQFYLPEPNTLHTPLGHLSRDILYWSTMGVSHGYTLFAGAMEVIPALLLLFERTRMLGAMIATVVVAHVVAINLGFDISVKLYSLFLLLLCLLLSRPGWVRIVDLFILNRGVDAVEPPLGHGSHPLLYASVKALVIVAIMFESLFPYFKSGDFDDDLAPRPFLHGAYDVDTSAGAARLIPSSSGGLKRVFIHRRGYFIVQSARDAMRDYRLEYDGAHRRLILDAHSDSAIVLDYSLAERDSLLTLRGVVGGDSIMLRARRIELDALPLLGPSFHWTIDGYR